MNQFLLFQKNKIFLVIIMKGGYIYKKKIKSRTKKHKIRSKLQQRKSRKNKSKFLKRLRKLTRKSFTY